MHGTRLLQSGFMQASDRRKNGARGGECTDGAAASLGKRGSGGRQERSSDQPARCKASRSGESNGNPPAGSGEGSRPIHPGRHQEWSSRGPARPTVASRRDAPAITYKPSQTISARAAKNSEPHKPSPCCQELPPPRSTKHLVVDAGDECYTVEPSVLVPMWLLVRGGIDSARSTLYL